MQRIKYGEELTSHKHLNKKLMAIFLPNAQLSIALPDCQDQLLRD